MSLQDLNQDNTYAVSPLSHDYGERFSRKGKVKKINPQYSHLVDSLLIFVFCFCLLAIDFILFAGSGNIEVFKDSVIPTPEVLLGMASFAAIVFVIVIVLYKYTIVKSSFAALIAFGFVYAVFTQFSQVQQEIVFGQSLHLSSYLVGGLILAGVTYIIFVQKYRLFKLLLTLAAVVLLADVYVGYIRLATPHEFLESHNSQKLSKASNKRFVYFLLPNLVSYPYLNGMKMPEAQETKNIMQGFYQKNDFKVYMQAYAPEQEYLDNMVVSFNPLSEKTVKSHLLKTKMTVDYWQFQNLKNEYIYLKNNQLYNMFRKNKFQISAYKSRDFDMCHAQHKINVNRCIEKINQPTNIYSMSLSVVEKTKILMFEWLSSWFLFDNMSSIYHALEKVVDADKIPMVGVNYNNLYVVNSIKTFDILLDDMQKDSGRQAYFVFADIPSNMYIYDEFCQLKPQEDWLDMMSLPWIKRDYTLQRQTAYLQQTKCLYGKFEQFIDQLKENNMWDDTTIVIQGTSGVNNFKNYRYTKFIDNFIANRLVTMAIHDKKQKNTEADMELCPTNNILTRYLLHTNASCDQTKLGIHSNLYQTLQQKLQQLTRGANIDHSAEFTAWYQKWQAANNNNASENGTDIFQDFNAYDFIDTEDAAVDEIEDITDEDFGLEDINSSNKEILE